MHQTLVGMGLSMIISVILVYLLMVALYNSYISPFIIIFSVPVAAIGAIGALFLTHRTLNLFSLIGTILLIGIATKNGILLVDYANTLRSRGLDKLSAIKESAHTRFRPIIMTSFSVVAGNLPLALALDPGSSSRSSLGIVVIGGVLQLARAYAAAHSQHLHVARSDRIISPPRRTASAPVRQQPTLKRRRFQSRNTLARAATRSACVERLRSMGEGVGDGRFPRAAGRALPSGKAMSLNVMSAITL